VMEGPDRLGLKTPARDQPPKLPPRAKQGEHITWAVLESDFETYYDASYQLPDDLWCDTRPASYLLWSRSSDGAYKECAEKICRPSSGGEIRSACSTDQLRTTHACRGVCSRHRSMHRFPVQEADMWATCQKIARSGRYRMCPLNYPSHIATLPRLLERLARICHVRHSLCRRRHLCRHRESRGDQCGRCRRLHRWCRRRRRRRCCGRRRRWRRGSWRRCGRGRARHAAGHDTARLGVEEGGVVLHQPATARGCTSQQEVSVCDTR